MGRRGVEVQKEVSAFQEYRALLMEVMRERYKLGPNDDIHLLTGVVMKAAAPTITGPTEK